MFEYLLVRLQNGIFCMYFNTSLSNSIEDNDTISSTSVLNYLCVFYRADGVCLFSTHKYFTSSDVTILGDDINSNVVKPLDSWFEKL